MDRPTVKTDVKDRHMDSKVGRKVNTDVQTDNKDVQKYGMRVKKNIRINSKDRCTEGQKSWKGG